MSSFMKEAAGSSTLQRKNAALRFTGTPESATQGSDG